MCSVGGAKYFYQRDRLLELRGSPAVPNRLPIRAAFLCRNLGIANYRRTRRGRRGGRMRRRPIVQCNLLHFGLLNTRSMLNKLEAVHQHISECKLDVLAVTETWLKPSTGPVDILPAIPSGYTAVQVPRSDGRKGGGVAIIFR